MKEDWFLRVLAHTFPERGIKLSMTLSVKGMLVSGSPIIEEEYFERVANDIRSATSAGSPEVNTEWRETLAEIVGKLPNEVEKRLPDKEGESSQEERMEALPEDYVFLENVSVNQGSGVDVYEGSVWRGRLEEVDGFWLGALTPEGS